MGVQVLTLVAVLSILAEQLPPLGAQVRDVASRAREAVTDTASRVGDRTPSRGEVKQRTRQVAGMAKENPLGLAIGAAALGFLIGLVVPTTRVEDERLGPVADQVKDKVKETGQEVLERGRQVAQEVADTAAETAKERSQQHGQDLAQSARQQAEDMQSEARQSTKNP